jgi:hypothetical protein
VTIIVVKAAFDLPFGGRTRGGGRGLVATYHFTGLAEPWPALPD